MLIVISWTLRLVLAAILASTLYHKFTAKPESVALFTSLGMEPNGRILIGVLELVAAILLLVPISFPWGIVLAWGIFSGALIAHITKLGFSGDMLSLGLMSGTGWLIALGLGILHRDRIPVLKIIFDQGASAASA